MIFSRFFRTQVLLVLILGISGFQTLFSEETAAETAILDPPVSSFLSAEAVLEMDIATSTLSELAQWCRQLGLSDSGVRNTLADRLRSYYGLVLPDRTAADQDSEAAARIIIIESAKTTEYFTLEAVNEEYARLSGSVQVLLKDGDTSHRLSADSIIYNRTRNILSASGNVQYTKDAGDTIETFKGDSLSISLDDWSGSFLGGASERTMSEEDSSYKFAGKLISRDGEDVTVMHGAVITNADSEHPYWSINASRLWLLPGSEWAILNAVLKVGEIPLLYIPFFYIPGDELVFHPVLGYRSREGSYVQTTSYILGRPKAEKVSENSITRILGSGADTEREREGLFLRSTGRRIKKEEETSLSLLFDIYTNLGSYIGTEISLPRKGIFGAANISIGLGFSRDIYQIDNDYFTPFENFDGQSNWNRSRFFDIELPFRYRFKTDGSLSGKAGSLNWNIPMYSDPFINADFLNRSEDMDWFNMIKQGAALEDEAPVSSAVLASYEWRLNGRLNPSLPVLSPYISTISISNISSTLGFSSRNAANPSSPVAPDRTFFYPSKFTLLSLSTSVSGRPLQLGTTQTASGGPDINGDTESNPFDSLGIPRSPWNEETTDDSDTAPTDKSVLVPPPLIQRFETGLAASSSRLTLEYRLNPSGASVLQFRSSPVNWKDAEDVSWDEVSSILNSINASSSISAKMNGPGDIIGASFSISSNAAWQDYSYMNEESEDFNTQSKRDAALLRAYRASSFSGNYEYQMTLRALSGNEVWGSSNLQYTIKGLVARSAFIGDAENPEWDIIFGAWSRDKLSSHAAAVNVIADVRDKKQTLTLSTELPPNEAVLSASTSLRAWISQTEINTKIIDPYEDPIFKPVNFKETMNFSTGKSFVQEIVYDPEIKEYTSFVSTLRLGNFSSSYVASYRKPYVLEENLGWRISSEEASLQPLRFTMGYRNSSIKRTFFDKLVSTSFNINSSLSMDLQRYTNSNFSFIFGTTIKINDFLDISLSTRSENGLVFRYFQDWPIWPVTLDVPGETNLFKDLINSFRFDDDELRKSSGFKLKSFKLDATHYMGDWNAVLGIELLPYLDKTRSPFRYDFNSKVSFLVQWIPIPEIKTDIYKDKDGFVFR